jgi:multiple sugar transport system substrate-binding protein
MELQKAYPLYAQGLVAPIPVKELGYADEAALKDTYLPHMLDPVTDTDNKLGNGAGKIYGLPLEMVNFCMYVNKKMLKAAGVADPDKDYPKTWEDVLALTKKIVKHNGEIITRRGFDFRYPDYLISWVPMVEQLGGKVISDDGKEAIVGKDAWVKCLQFMKDWGPTGLNLGSPTLPEARKQFDNDKDEIAMHLSGFYQEARMRTANPTFFNSKDWEVIPYPVWKGGKHISNTYYFQYYMVNSQIPKAEQVECWKFIHFMLSHGEDYLKNVALTQPTKQVFDGAYFKSQPYSQVFRDDLKYAHCVYFSSFSWQINEAITQTIANIMSDPKLTADAAYTQLKKACQDIVDQNS